MVSWETHYSLSDKQALDIMTRPGQDFIYDSFYDGQHLFVPKTYVYIAKKKEDTSVHFRDEVDYFRNAFMNSVVQKVERDILDEFVFIKEEDVLGM
jgi:hypothetical protein